LFLLVPTVVHLFDVLALEAARGIREGSSSFEGFSPWGCAAHSDTVRLYRIDGKAPLPLKIDAKRGRGGRELMRRWSPGALMIGSALKE
jgi:hypothetical protein